MILGLHVTECFNCTSGRIIHRESVCDGYFDCPDQSDEINCQNHSCPLDSDHFQCKNSGHCIRDHYQCDGFSDCTDGSDEEKQMCKNRTNPYEFVSKNTFIAIWGLLNLLLGTFGNIMTMIAIPYAVWKNRWGLHTNWWTSSIFVVHLAFYDWLFSMFGMLDKIIYNLGYKWPFGSAFCMFSIKAIPIISQASWYALGFIAVSNTCQVYFNYR